MPQFAMPARGCIRVEGVEACLWWKDLDSFTQGYIEAAFFADITEDTRCPRDGNLLSGDLICGFCGNALTFGDITPEALAKITADCARFRRENEATLREAYEADPACDDNHAGRDLWYTRQGHGCGFWDGDWGACGDALTAASKAYGEVYIGEWF